MQRRNTVCGAGLFLCLCGGAVMTGWLTKTPVWEWIAPSGTLMVVTTALCFVVSGIGLAIPRFFPNVTRTAHVALGCVLMLMALMALSENIFSVDLGIDFKRLHEWYIDKNPHAGRMAPNTAGAFLLAGIAFMLGNHKRLGPLFHFMTAAVVTLGLIGLAGYTRLFDLAYGWYDIPHMAFTTSACVIVLGVALALGDPNRPKLLFFRSNEAPDAADDARAYAFLGVAVTILATSGFLSYGSVQALMSRSTWVEHTAEIRAEFESMMAIEAQGHNAWLTYLVTHESDRLDVAVAAGSAMSKNLDRILGMTVDNAEQHQRLATMKQLIGANDGILLKNGVRVTSDAEPSQAALLSNRHRFESLVTGFREEEKRLLTQRQSESRIGADDATAVIVVGNLLGFAILFYAARLIRRQSNLRDKLTDTLHDANSFLDSLLENLPVGVFVKDAHDLRYVRINKAGETIRGVPREEMLGKNNYDFLSREEADFFTARDYQTLESVSTIDVAEETIITRDLGPRIVHTIKVPVCDENGEVKYLLGLSEDITERKKAEDSLRRNNIFLDSLLENMPVAVFVKEAENLRYVRVNKAAETLLGLDRTETLDKGDHDFLPHDEAELSSATDRHVLTSGLIADIPERTVHTHRRGVRVLHTMKIPIHDENGKAQYMLGMSEDITERKQAENKIVALNEDLKARATELEGTNKELESFTYSVSHDLRAPLRAINGYALMLGEDFKDVVGDEGRRYIGQIHAYSKQMGELIDDLLRLSRLGRQALNKIDVDMAELLKSAMQAELDARRGTTPSAKINIAPLPRASVDPMLLRQVWGNLISNALKYSSKSADPMIEVSAKNHADEVVYCVKDNGVGFDMNYYDKLFNVFQRLHRADEFPGTGVGLAIVHRVITRHGGRVWAEGKSGQGAAFYFALPGQGGLEINQVG